MANVNVAAVEILPQAGSDSKGQKLGIVSLATKAAQNDTLTVTNASSFKVISCIDDTTGAFETHTISGNVITLTSVTTGTKTLTVLYR